MTNTTEGVVPDKVTPAGAALPTEAVSTYLDVLAIAARHGVLDPFTYELAVDAIVNHWPDDDPRWSLLEQAS